MTQSDRILNVVIIGILEIGWGAIMILFGGKKIAPAWPSFGQTFLALFLWWAIPTFCSFIILHLLYPYRLKRVTQMVWNIIVSWPYSLLSAGWKNWQV